MIEPFLTDQWYVDAKTLARPAIAAVRDGTTTFADVFRPDVSGSVPALLQRTPYNKSAGMNRTGTLDAITAAAARRRLRGSLRPGSPAA